MRDRLWDRWTTFASRDRDAASRFVSPPPFERLWNVDVNVAIVDRG